MWYALSDSVKTLIGLAAVTGFIHTVAGPDHYIPFVALSRARRWSPAMTTIVTVLCGLGHVLSSVLLGGVGIAAGMALSSMESIESTRGDLAAWIMIAFGLVYAAMGFKRLGRNKPHRHSHFHKDGEAHIHTHLHEGAHVHVHEARGETRSITPWVLFIIFVFGPCEVLIPLLLVPAANESLLGMILVASVFGIVTIGTMIAMVLSLSIGLGRIRFGWLERHTHAVAGLSIALCGALILLGL